MSGVGAERWGVRVDVGFKCKGTAKRKPSTICDETDSDTPLGGGGAHQSAARELAFALMQKHA